MLLEEKTFQPRGGAASSEKNFNGQRTLRGLPKASPKARKSGSKVQSTFSTWPEIPRPVFLRDDGHRTNRLAFHCPPWEVLGRQGTGRARRTSYLPSCRQRRHRKLISQCEHGSGSEGQQEQHGPQQDQGMLTSAKRRGHGEGRPSVGLYEGAHQRSPCHLLLREQEGLVEGCGELGWSGSP